MAPGSSNNLACKGFFSDEGDSDSGGIDDMFVSARLFGEIHQTQILSTGLRQITERLNKTA